MPTEPTPEMLALARSIAEATRIEGPLGLGPQRAEKAALAALIQGAEMAADSIVEHCRACNAKGREASFVDVVRNIRNFEQYKKGSADAE